MGTAQTPWRSCGDHPVCEDARQRDCVSSAITPPTTILWPEHDPLFSRDWSDAVDDWFAAADLRFVDGIGHFVPLEAPEVFAAAIREH